MRFEILATGNELLDGSIYDRHTFYVANQLKPYGISVQRTTIVTDEPEELRQGLFSAYQRADVVLISGGLGPTTDDRTLEIAAEVFGSSLVESKEAKENVLRILRKRKPARKINEGHRKMFLIPKGSQVVTNIAGAAPAVSWQIGNKILFFLPGPPHEFSRVFEDHLLSFFKKMESKENGTHLFVFKVFGWPESELSRLCESLKIPKEIEVGFRTTLPENHIKLFVKAESRQAAIKKIAPITIKLEAKLQTCLFSKEASETFGESVFKRLKQNNKKVALAESCTGGLAASMITAVAGSSEVFERGFVTYSNESKIELLGVSKKILEKYGAVSEQTACEMAEGALKNSKADLAVAITGIAGPSGGTKQKPVGTVWLAKAQKTKKTKAKLLELRFDREMNQKFSAYAALEWLGNAN